MKILIIYYRIYSIICVCRTQCLTKKKAFKTTFSTWGGRNRFKCTLWLRIIVVNHCIISKFFTNLICSATYLSFLSLKSHYFFYKNDSPINEFYCLLSILPIILYTISINLISVIITQLWANQNFFL